MIDKKEVGGYYISQPESNTGLGFSNYNCPFIINFVLKF